MDTGPDFPTTDPPPRRIDLATYPRRALYQVFVDRELPVYSVTATVDATAFVTRVRALGLGFFVPFSHLLSRAVNAIPEFRHRIVAGELCEFAVVHPSVNVLLDNRTFCFCDLRHFDDFARYRADAQRRIEAARRAPVWDSGAKDGHFFITNLPWLAFTSITHPYVARYASLPLISVGRCHAVGSGWQVPVAIQVHHALVDGIHLGEFYERLGVLCREPALPESE